MKTPKEKFLKEELIALLRKLPPSLKGSWGKMNAQQMVEHLSGAFRIASGKHKMQPAFSPEITEKYHAFLMTENPFKENTPNKLLPDEPEPFKNATMEGAIAELQKEIDGFFS